MYTRIGGKVKKPSSLLINVAGAWKRVKEGKIKVAGVWRQFYYDWQAFQLTGTSNGPAGQNNYHYETYSNQAITIAAGDRLSVDYMTTDADLSVGFDFSFTRPNGTVDAGRFNTNIVDQNGWPIHPSSSISILTRGKWLNRTFDLSALAGSVTREWCAALEADAPGVYHVWLRDVTILDAAGNLKYRILGDTLPVPGLQAFEIANFGEGAGTTVNYSNISKGMVAAPL